MLPLDKHYRVAQKAWEMGGSITVCTFLTTVVFLKHISQSYSWRRFYTAGELPPFLVSTNQNGWHFLILKNF